MPPGKKSLLLKNVPSNISHVYLWILYLKTQNLGCFLLDLILFLQEQFSLTNTLFDVGDSIK